MHVPDVDVDRPWSAFELLNNLAALPTGHQSWHLDEITLLRGRDGPIQEAPIIRLALPADFSFESEPADMFTAADARRDTVVEGDGDGYTVIGFSVGASIMAYAPLSFDVPTDTRLACGIEYEVVQKESVSPMAYKLSARTDTLPKAVTVLAALMEVVDARLERPYGDRTPPDEREASKGTAADSPD
jgi:hypothetical protein